MASFGENLQREREMRGVTLQEIAAATKISVRFLEAIETEQFSRLPGGIFIRSFIRAYAKYLGLDEERVLAEFQMAAGPTHPPDLTRIAAHKLTSATHGAHTPWLALLVAAILLAAGYGLFRYSRRGGEIPVSVPQSVSAPASSDPAAAASTVTAEATLPLTSAGPADAPPAGEYGRTAESPGQAPSPRPSSTSFTGLATIPGMLTLQVAATERSWVAVEADGKTILQRVMAPNEVETFQAKESFAVTTGNAQGVILTLNGETLKPLGRQGEVKSVRLSRSDLKNLAP